MNTLRRTTCTLVLLAVAGACSSDAPEPVSPAEAAKTQPPATSPHPPIPAAHPDVPSVPPSARPAAGIPFTAPAEWVAEAPKTGSRLAQYRLPKVEGDPEDGELAVFRFPGGAGDVESNIVRWCGQFEQPDGKLSKDVLERSQRKVNGVSVTEVALTGRFVAETMPGTGERVDKKSWAMLAAIVETPGDPYIIKLTGPEKTIARWRETFVAFISSVKP